MSEKSAQPRRPSQKGAALLREFALPVGFLLVAAALWFSPRRAQIPVNAPVVVERAALAVAPRRTAVSDPPQILVEGRSENCNACHQIFKSAHGGGELLTYHTEIRLNHGLNTRCINCHDVDNRELLTLRDGATVPYSDTPLLCAQCHGTVYRDWQNGTHGKTLGSWVTGSAARRRLNCNECHDPHSPRYPAFEPLPGPNTLRMGAVEGDVHHEPASESPLQRWLGAEAQPRSTRQAASGDHP